MTAAVRVPLTPVQRRMVDEFRQFVAEYGYAPTIRELANQVGRTPSAIAYQVQQSEAKGWLRRQPRSPRALVLLDPPAGTS